ncbi:MAG: hypothetical protein AB7F35_02000 [Acetobacteraceae bacterium]
MATTPILGISELASNQNQKEITINNMIVALEAAGNAVLAVSFTANAKTLSASDYTRYVCFTASNQTATATLIVPLTQRLFLVHNANATYDIVVGAVTGSTVTVPPASLRLIYCDGTDCITVTAAVASVSFADLPAAVQNAPIAIPFVSTPAAGREVHIPLGQAYTLPADFAGTIGYAKTVPTADAVFTVALVRTGSPTTVGTVTFAAGSSTLTLSTQAAVSMLATDTLRITAPSPADATLADLAITLMLQKA